MTMYNDLPHNGRLEIIFGPMFSGKSTELTRRIRRFKIASKNCLVIKYAGDTRYDAVAVGSVVTHDDMACAATPLKELNGADQLVASFDVIGIDEGQFFPDIVEACERWANMGKIVLVAALDGTFQRQAFNRVLELVPLAESVIKLSSVCTSCFADAAFSKRLGAEMDVEVIGGADKYVAMCRACYFNASMATPKQPEKSKTCSFTPQSAEMSDCMDFEADKENRDPIQGYGPASPVTPIELSKACAHAWNEVGPCN